MSEPAQRHVSAVDASDPVGTGGAAQAGSVLRSTDSAADTTPAPGVIRPSSDAGERGTRVHRRWLERSSLTEEARPSSHCGDSHQDGVSLLGRDVKAEQPATVPSDSRRWSPPAATAVTSDSGAGTESGTAPGTTETDAEDQLTHLELETVYRDTLSGLLASDPLLSDLSASLTAAELRSLTALEHGTAMAVLVNRGDRLTRVIVQRSATVRELKAALRSAVELELARRGGQRRAIGWRYVWRANWLAFGGLKLKDDDARLEELGIGNKAEVGFVKRIRAKRGQRDKKGGQV